MPVSFPESTGSMRCMRLRRRKLHAREGTDISIGAGNRRYARCQTERRTILFPYGCGLRRSARAIRLFAVFRREADVPKPRLYVIHVAGGQEEHTKALVLKLLADIASDCYTPAYECARKVGGVWRRVAKMLFPGYVFVETSDPVALRDRLGEIPAFARLLGASDESFLALTDDEVAWLNAFTNVETHVVEMSEGIIEGDRVLVTKGPLRSYEGLIRKVDRHKRLAELEIHMFGRDKRVRIGLEIARKRSE